MKGRAVQWSLGWGLLGLGALALVGCQHGHAGYGRHGRVVVVEGDAHHSGPPAHAPAHGYRRKHGDVHHTHNHKRPYYEPGVAVELVFDDDLGVHVVVGHAGVYFHADHYYRLGDAGWEWTARLGHSWAAAPDHGVPTGLRKLHHGRKGPKAKARHSQTPPPERRDHLERSHAPSTPAKAGMPAKAGTPAKASTPRKAAAASKARAPKKKEKPSPEHRHQHDEHPGRGWN